MEWERQLLDAVHRDWVVVSFCFYPSTYDLANNVSHISICWTEFGFTRTNQVINYRSFWIIKRCKIVLMGLSMSLIVVILSATINGVQEWRTFWFTHSLAPRRLSQTRNVPFVTSCSSSARTTSSNAPLLPSAPFTYAISWRKTCIVPNIQPLAGLLPHLCFDQIHWY